MHRKNVNRLILALMVIGTVFAGQYLHLEKRWIMLLGAVALLAWIAFLSVLLTGKGGPRKSRRMPPWKK
ncbi:MAG TPA: hypothetical protein VN441_12505 [Syntrophomonas sp.]|jgi:hypothetical protein|nr:hypothetical protein [Syntrophomonas sp.]